MKTLLLISSILTINSYAQCVGTGCPGGSGGGAVSSVFSRTGTVTAAAGDYTSDQVTATTARPDILYCPTSAYSTGVYTCATGLSLTIVPPTGTIVIVDMLQACNVALNNAITIDSLPAKLMFLDDGSQAVFLGMCSSGSSTVILRIKHISNSNMLLTVVGHGFSPVCLGTAGGVYYYNAGAFGCSNNLIVSEANTYTSVKHLNGDLLQIPSIAAGAAAGSSPTIALDANSTDVAGQINITTGAAPTTGVEATVTFKVAYSTIPYCTVTPANAATALVTGTTMVYSSTTLSTLVLNSGSLALTTATAYSWYYHCIQ